MAFQPWLLVIALLVAVLVNVFVARYSSQLWVKLTGHQERNLVLAERMEVAAMRAEVARVRLAGEMAWTASYGMAVDAGCSYPTALHRANDGALATWRREGQGGPELAMWLGELCEAAARRTGAEVVVERGVEVTVVYQAGPVFQSDSRAMHFQAQSLGAGDEVVAWSTGGQVANPCTLLVKPVEWVAGVDEPAKAGRPPTPPGGTPAAPVASEAARTVTDAPTPYEALREVTAAEIAAAPSTPWVPPVGPVTGEMAAVGEGFAGALERGLADAARVTVMETKGVCRVSADVTQDCSGCTTPIPAGVTHVLVEFLSESGYGEDRFHRMCFVRMSGTIIAQGGRRAEQTLDVLEAELASGEYNVPAPPSPTDNGH